MYGTLKPGQSRWPALAYYVDSTKPVLSAEIEGQMWATPWGWPAVTAGMNIVRGVLVTLRPDRVTEALTRLDEIEGTSSGLFERVAVTTRSGTPCWTYLWPGSTAGFTSLASGEW
ncbi:gamma-glutamylcyclotransferase [Skermania sp. ID1734]|uniref:gamma-glutamylcyclotransferase family protein n=1 Tax=Skermania sp. ID1734 TaxID=2597516 RepID=UPI00351BBE65